MKFANPERALRWAYETNSRPIGDNVDRHSEAALIIGLCERVLPVLHMAYVRIQFGREASGFPVLSNHLAHTFGTGLHSRRSIEKIIRAYCGEKIGLREIRKAMNCGMLKAASYRNQAYDALDVIHVQSMDRLRTEMEVRGYMAGQS
ncbi:hypothetical protein [Nitrosospira sp. Nl5]|uniref:hypothetical protein n=1 Tax=Nitrosospira sp. Nl5 TaxID=200120 RepID=UPI000B85D5BE|nr:hypothetical protein [Nitrosospira sp. Nl5]